ncbi:nucleotide-diphospho-sugar transferase [Neocallimastix lanati (nom. inval.)]|nr:nucleotide-diphospho-sugar transferase [Neocallimastix sp. JGI-2020a]
MFILKKIVFLFFYIVILLTVKSYSKIKISVVIPVYNTELYLERSIQSVLNQSLKEIEIICIDDSSTDNSLNILNEFKKKDSRIRIIHFEENKGPSISRNTGINISNGEFIGFLDSDDYVDEKFFENLYQYTKNYDVVVGTFVRSINGSDKYIHHENFTNIEGFVCDSIFRRKFLDDNNIRFPTNKRFMEDKIFRKNCYYQHPKIYKAPDEGIYYYYKQRMGSLCNYGKKQLKRLYKNMKKNSMKKKIKNKKKRL